MNATTISVDSSHASPVSHPDEIAQLILDAAKGSTKMTYSGTDITGSGDSLTATC